MGWGARHRGRDPCGGAGTPIATVRPPAPPVSGDCEPLDPVGRGETRRRRASRADRAFGKEAPRIERCARARIRLRQHFTGRPRADSRLARRSTRGGCAPHRPESGPSRGFGAPYAGRTSRRPTGRAKAAALAAPGRGAVPGGRPGRRRPRTTGTRSPGLPDGKQAWEGRKAAGGRGEPAPRRLPERGSRSCGGGGHSCVRGSRERPRPRAGDGGTLHQSPAGVNPPRAIAFGRNTSSAPPKTVRRTPQATLEPDRRPISALYSRKSTSANGSSAITTHRESRMRSPCPPPPRNRPAGPFHAAESARAGGRLSGRIRNGARYGRPGSGAS